MKKGEKGAGARAGALEELELRTWSELVAFGDALRRRSEGAAVLQDRFGRIGAWVASVTANGEPALRHKAEALAQKPLGPLGRLALCELGATLRRPPDVLMAVVHVLLLRNATEHGVSLRCVGIVDDDDDDEEEEEEEGEEDDDDNGDTSAQKMTFDPEARWPEIFPDGWLIAKPRSYSFRYLVVANHASREQLDGAQLAIKGAIMGSSKLLVNGMLQGKGTQGKEPVSASISIKDFVASSSKDAVEKSFENETLGVCGLITRASALQLAGLVRTELLEPFFGKRIVEEENAGASASSADPEGEGNTSGEHHGRNLRAGRPGYGADFRGNPAGVGGGRGFLGGPGGFGDDLLPGGGTGQGGMLFGPGNAAFDGRGGGNRPAGVPPGARFDPFGPPGVVPRGGGFGPRPRGPPRGGPGPGNSFGGDPDPDHLPPPHGADDMYF